MDCLDFLKLIPDNSVDSCVTDPPYGLAFMGKKWDKHVSPGAMQKWSHEWSLEIFRVLKPGSRFLAFSGTRTYHRLACAIEDAGFFIQDQIHWLYGSGFPKGLNISKAIDKKLGSEKKIVGKGRSGKKRGVYTAGTDDNPDWFGGDYDITIPTSDLARIWEGWNTHLKPAHEPIVLAEKPREGSYVDNILKWGVGGMNIDACRIAVDPEVDDMDREVSRKPRESETWETGSGFKNEKNVRTGVLESGRYPANLILSHHPDCQLIQAGKTEAWSRPRNEGQNTGKHGIYGDRDRPSRETEFRETIPEIWECVEGCPVRILNEQGGMTKSAGGRSYQRSSSIYGQYDWEGKVVKGCGFGDSGGVARFFYCAKASKAERNLGLSGQNPHVTVKPLALMRYLIRLVTPKEGVVLDPFLGSGTTAIAAELEGVEWLGCEISAEYCKLAKDRIEAWRGDTFQQRLDF